MSEGGCVAGSCAPAYTECVAIPNPAQGCDQICGDLGKACVEAGCQGGTRWKYLAGQLCETHEAGTSAPTSCASLVTDDGVYTHVRCCCQQP